MLKFIMHKILYIGLVLLGITLISFVLANASEVDPAEAYARRQFKGPARNALQKSAGKRGLTGRFPNSICVGWDGWFASISASRMFPISR